MGGRADHRRRLSWLHGLYAWLGGTNGTNGWLEFRDDGIWFQPGWTERRVFRMQRQRLAAWEDVSVIELAPSSLSRPLWGCTGLTARID